MPNKHWEMEVDVLPKTTNTYNLGDATKKWVVNGYTLNEACSKNVDTTIDEEAESTNLPTTSAVVEYVKDQGMSTVSVSGKILIID